MPARKGKVLVAMSGGVDSSVAAAMLLREGYEVVGVFMRLGSPGEELDTLQTYDDAAISCDPRKIKIGHQGCCSINDAADARLVAAELGIPFYVVNFKKEFGRIIEYFVDEYARGRTPNPCVRCNDWLKFGKLRAYAEQIGAAFVASGHYARVEARGRFGVQGASGDAGDPDRAGEPALLRGVDAHKDQSYVLFGVPRAHLGHMLLPIGGYTKDRIREMAREFGLPTFDKPDSQEICFVPDNDYAGLVERRRPELAREGTVVDVDGRQVGTHAGHYRFTLGQRRGVGVALGYPIFVVGKDPATNVVTVGSREDLLVRSCIVGEVNALVEGLDRHDEVSGRESNSQPAASDGLSVLAKFRSTSEPVLATLRVLPAIEGESTPSGRRGRWVIEFAEPQEAVAPGQALVAYDANDPARVLGGGWIESAQRVI